MLLMLLVFPCGLKKMDIPLENWNEQFIICKYGAFDTKTDIEPNGDTNTERFNCGQRGLCLGENKVCKPIRCEFGKLTPRLETVLKYIAKGLLDKEIADKMFLSTHTVKNHRRKLQQIIGTGNKAGLSAFAVSKNLI